MGMGRAWLGAAYVAERVRAVLRYSCAGFAAGQSLDANAHASARCRDHPPSSRRMHPATGPVLLSCCRGVCGGGAGVVLRYPWLNVPHGLVRALAVLLAALRPLLALFGLEPPLTPMEVRMSMAVQHAPEGTYQLALA